MEEENEVKKAQERLAARGLVGIGIMLLGIGLFTDPIGDDPDSGLIELGVSGTRHLLTLGGGAAALAGLVGIVIERKR